MMPDVIISKREELRAWLDEQRGAESEEPLSGTLALAEMVRDLLARVEELDAQAVELRDDERISLLTSRVEAVEAIVATPPGETPITPPKGKTAD
jgi:hypothetical protein